MYEIANNVPVPDKIGRKGAKSVYPFSSMNIGDSILIPKDKAGVARAAASRWKQRHAPWSYTAAVEGDGLRIWRTA